MPSEKMSESDFIIISKLKDFNYKEKWGNTVLLSFFYLIVKEENYW